MKYMELIAPCHFGMEAVLKREILDLGYEISKVEDGKVTFLADADGIAQANMFLRTTERILLKTGEFKAVTFDELFEKTKAIPWEDYIPKDGKFWVAKANSVKSALFSPSDIQSIMKKAIVERLKSVYGISWFPEDGASFPIRVAFMKDVATIGIDTSGVSLHKRGYRQMTVKAPITGDSGLCIDHADSVEQRENSGRSFLWKWNLPDRGGNDGCGHGTGNEPFFPCGGLEASCSAQMLVRCPGRGSGPRKS